MEKTDRTQLTATLLKLIALLFVAYLIVFFLGLYVQDLKMVIVTGIGALTQIIPFMLLRYKKPFHSSVFISVSMLISLTLLATFGQGYHDISIVAFPVILIFTAITLNRKMVLLNFLLVLLSLSWLFFGEKYMWYTPLCVQSLNLTEFFILILIFLILTITVDLLVQNLRAALKHEETARRNTEEIFLNFFDIFPSACGISDIKTRKYFTVNTAFSGILGFTREDVIGKSSLDLQILTPEQSKEILQKADPAGNISNVEAVLKTKNGSIRNVLLSASSIALGSDTFRFTVVNDITERKAAEAEKQALLAQLQEDQRTACEQLFRLNSKILPLTANFHITGYYGPCELLGGDIVLVLKDKTSNSLLTLLADCTGHGVRAALEATLLKAVIERFVAELFLVKDPGLFLRKVSSALASYHSESISGISYPTMFVGITDLKTNVFTYANANGELPYIIEKNNTGRILPPVSGFHLGFEDEKIHFENKTYTIQPGEKLFLFSDAAREITLTENTQLGHSGLMNLLYELSSSGNTEIPKIVDRLVDINNGPLTDDLTIIQLEYHAPEVQHITINEISEMQIVKEMNSKLVLNYNFSHENLNKTNIALEEMLLNALYHGNKNDPRKKVSLKMEIDCEKAVYTISDEGEGFNPGLIPNPTDLQRIKTLIEESNPDENDSELFHGRGIYITKTHLASDLRYNEKGNSVTFTISRTPFQTINKNTICPVPETPKNELQISDNLITIPRGYHLSSFEISVIITQALKNKTGHGKPLLVSVGGNKAVRTLLSGFRLVDLGLIVLQ